MGRGAPRAQEGPHHHQNDGEGPHGDDDDDDQDVVLVGARFTCGEERNWFRLGALPAQFADLCESEICQDSKGSHQRQLKGPEVAGSQKVLAWGEDWRLFRIRKNNNIYSLTWIPRLH